MGKIGLGFTIIAVAMLVVAALAFGSLFMTEPDSAFRPFAAISSTVIILVGLVVGLYVASDPSAFKGPR